MKKKWETVPAGDRTERAKRFMITGFVFSHGGEVLEAYGNGLFRTTEPIPHPQGIARFASAVICVNVLRPFAIEHFLKGLSVKSVGGYRRSHDLVQLYDDLRPEVQAISEKLAAADGIEPIRDILSRHRNDFESWRYVAFAIPKPDIQALDDIDRNLRRVYVHEEFKRLCQAS